MRKLMIAMLALAVVFGFAACDNNSGSASLTDQYVVSLEVTSGPEAYFAGQKVDVADYTVTATRVDGSTFTVPSEDLAFSSDSSLTANEDKTSKEIGSIYYTGFYKVPGTTPSVAVEADVYTVDAIDVAVVADQATYYVGSSLKNLKDDYTVTAYAFASTVKTSDYTAENALYYAVIDSSDITLNDGSNDLTATSKFSAEGLKTIKFKLFGAEVSQAIKDGKSTANLVVQADYVADFTVAQVTTATATGTKDVDYKYAVVGGTISKDAAAKAYLVITETMASGEVKTIVGNDITYTVAAAPNQTDTEFTSGKAYNVTVKGKYGAAQTEKTLSLGITPVDNDIISFTVSDGPSTIAAGDELEAKAFTVTATWLDDAADDVITGADLNAKLRIDGGATYTVPDNYPTNTALQVKLTLDGYPNATTTSTISTKSV